MLLMLYRLMPLFGSRDDAFWFGSVFGFCVGFLFLYGLLKYLAWKDNLTEYEAWKNNQPETIDAQFVENRPRPNNAPQLNSSTAITRRTNIERRRV